MIIQQNYHFFEMLDFADGVVRPDKPGCPLRLLPFVMYDSRCAYKDLLRMSLENKLMWAISMQ